MPLGSSQRKLSFNTMNNTTHRHLLVERCSTLRACESCKRKKRVCNGQRPCSHCNDSKECIYSVVSDHARGVFTTSTARRLSSGSACETCRRRKTKCDGGSPCNYCATNQLECINNSERRKRSLANIHQYQQQSTINTNNSNNSTTTTNNNNNNTNTQPLLSSPLSSSSSSLTTNTIKSTKNNKNNKKLQLSSSSSSSTTTTTTSTTSSSSSNTLQSKELDGNEAMDRIEDRLSRIEKLMKAFSPTNTLSQTSSYQDMLLHQSYSTNTSSSALRKMSSPVHATFQKHQSIRPHRHSVQGITVAKEKAELRAAFHMSNSNSNSNSSSPSSLTNQYPTPPNSKSSSNQLLSTSSSLSTLSSSTSSSSSTANTNNTTTTTTTTLPPPLPPSISNNNSNNNNNNNNASHKLTHSMLNLTLSPSSSTSSTTNNIIINNNNTMISPSLPPPPHSPPHYYTNDILNRSPSPEGDWKSPIPSLMDQLSQRTFHSNAMEYTVHYPIYPLTPPPPHSHDH